jgi:Tfp pilus assembly protein PilF
MTEFALMTRSDHSMLPPTPSATIKFKSPNACNICHKDKSPEWADKLVRKWRKRDYQAPILHRAGLIDAARKGDWSKLPEILAYIDSKDRDEIFATSLIRLLQACHKPEKWPAILKALNDPSPLVRSAAAVGLASYPTPEVAKALLNATRDEFRLVRIMAAASLAAYPRRLLKPEDSKSLKAASDEYEAFLQSRPDDWRSYYNLGNWFLNRGEFQMAAISYEKAVKMEPRSILPRVNVALAYSRLKAPSKAEEALLGAVKIDPNSVEANYNLGLLKAEKGEAVSAKQHLLKAWNTDTTLAGAAFNLGVLMSEESVDDAIEWLNKAYQLRPDMAKYGYTLAFYSYRKGDAAGAVDTLEKVVDRSPAHPDSYMLLGKIYEEQGKIKEAAATYTKALENKSLLRLNPLFTLKLRKLNDEKGGK